MTNQKTSLEAHAIYKLGWKNVKRRLRLVLLFIGLADSIYLELARAGYTPLVCAQAGLINCHSVITSSYSVVLGIPLSVYAIVWFLVAIALLYVKNDDIRFIWYVFGIGAVIYSLSSMYMLKEICEYCLLIDIVVVALAYANFFVGRRNKKD